MGLKHHMDYKGGAEFPISLTEAARRVGRSVRWVQYQCTGGTSTTKRGRYVYTYPRPAFLEKGKHYLEDPNNGYKCATRDGFEALQKKVAG